MKCYLSLLLGSILIAIALIFLFSCIQNEAHSSSIVPKNQNYFVKLYISSIINDVFESSLVEFTKKTPTNAIEELKTLLKKRLAQKVKGNFSKEFDKKTKFYCINDDCCLEILEDFNSYFEFRGKKYPIFKKGDKYCLGFNIEKLAEILRNIDNFIGDLNNSVLEYGATEHGWGCKFTIFNKESYKNYYYKECKTGSGNQDCAEKCNQEFRKNLESKLKNIVSKLPIKVIIDYKEESKEYEIPIYYCFPIEAVSKIKSFGLISRRFGGKRHICFKGKDTVKVYQKYYSEIKINFILRYQVGGTYYEVKFSRIAKPKKPPEIKNNTHTETINQNWYKIHMNYQEKSIFCEICKCECPCPKRYILTGSNLKVYCDLRGSFYYDTTQGQHICCNKDGCRCCGFCDPFYYHVKIIKKLPGDDILGLYYKEEINKKRYSPKYIIHKDIKSDNFCMLYGTTKNTDIRCKGEGLAEIPFKYLIKAEGYVSIVWNMKSNDIIFFKQ